MHRSPRMFQLIVIAVIAVIAVVPSAFAQEDTQTPPTDPAAASAPATSEPSAAPAAEDTTAAVAAPAATAAASQAKYGVAFRFRWVSIPSWFLGLFTQKSVPLSTYGYALEGYRRKVDRDDPNRTWELNVGIGFQNMSPSDGYWLGKGKQKELDADLVQARNFSLITMDAAFVSRQYFSRYFGIHYGAGLGLAVVRGKILRTSATYDPATDQYTVRSSGTQICDASAKCNETLLAAGQGRDGGPTDPHRFEETSIPGAIPIINLLFGLDFPVPDAKGLEFRIEGGFYNAFFLGGTAGYVF